MRRRFSKFVSLALLLMGLTAVLPQGVSLCVADDGHLAVEIAHDGADCTTDEQRHHEGEESDECSELTEHSCLDVSPSLSSTKLTSRPDLTLPTSGLALTLPSDFGVIASAIVAVRAEASHLSPTAVSRVLRKTVLRL